MHVLAIARRTAPVESASAVATTEGAGAPHVVGVVRGVDHLRRGGANLDAVEAQCLGGEGDP